MALLSCGRLPSVWEANLSRSRQLSGFGFALVTLDPWLVVLLLLLLPSFLFHVSAYAEKHRPRVHQGRVPHPEKRHQNDPTGQPMPVPTRHVSTCKKLVQDARRLHSSRGRGTPQAPRPLWTELLQPVRFGPAGWVEIDAACDSTFETSSTERCLGGARRLVVVAVVNVVVVLFVVLFVVVLVVVAGDGSGRGVGVDEVKTAATATVQDVEAGQACLFFSLTHLLKSGSFPGPATPLCLATTPRPCTRPSINNLQELGSASIGQPYQKNMCFDPAPRPCRANVFAQSQNSPSGKNATAPSADKETNVGSVCRRRTLPYTTLREHRRIRGATGEDRRRSKRGCGRRSR